MCNFRSRWLQSFFFFYLKPWLIAHWSFIFNKVLLLLTKTKSFSAIEINKTNIGWKTKKMQQKKLKLEILPLQLVDKFKY